MARKTGKQKPAMLPLPPQVPACDELAAVSDDSQKLGDFITWFNETHRDENLSDFVTDKLLAEYFGIDLDQVETERREILAYQRLLNAWQDIRKELLLNGESD